MHTLSQFAVPSVRCVIFRPVWERRLSEELSYSFMDNLCSDKEFPGAPKVAHNISVNLVLGLACVLMPACSYCAG